MVQILSPNHSSGSEASPRPQTQPFAMWKPPQPPIAETSTNGRRVDAMTRHRRVTPLAPARGHSSRGRARGRGRGPGNVLSQSTNRNATVTDLLKNYKFDIAILAHPVSATLLVVIKKLTDINTVITCRRCRTERIFSK
jgi:hypothetical protein